MTEEDHQHQSPIKTPKQLVIVVVLAFLVPIVVIGLLSQLVTSGMTGARDDEAARRLRIAPVGAVDVADPNAPHVALSGEQVFGQVCKTCHEAGLAGAPKMGDNAAWAPRIAQGAATLFKHAIEGFTGKNGMMPAKGGNTDLADDDVERAVVYMANRSGGKLAEPKPTANAVAAAPAAAGPVAVAAAATTPVAAAAPAPAASASTGGRQGDVRIDVSRVPRHRSRRRTEVRRQGGVGATHRRRPADAAPARAPRLPGQVRRDAREGRQHRAVRRRGASGRRLHGVGGEVAVTDSPAATDPPSPR